MHRGIKLPSRWNAGGLARAKISRDANARLLPNPRAAI